jgi:hypothetical protein
MLHLLQIPAQLKVEPNSLSSNQSNQSHMPHNATLAGTAFIGEGSQMLLPRGGGGGEEEIAEREWRT